MTDFLVYTLSHTAVALAFCYIGMKIRDRETACRKRTATGAADVLESLLGKANAETRARDTGAV